MSEHNLKHSRKGVRKKGIKPVRYYAQIPQDLLRNPGIPLPVRLLYGLYHSYARKKNINKVVTTFVSQATLAKDLGCCSQSVSNWMQILMEHGWITVRKKMDSSNLVRLHGKPTRRTPGELDELPHT